MPSNKQNKPKRHRRAKKRAPYINREKDREINNSNLKRPDLVLWTNQVINYVVTQAGGRVDIVPTITTFPASVQTECALFQQYRIAKVQL